MSAPAPPRPAGPGRAPSRSARGRPPPPCPAASSAARRASRSPAARATAATPTRSPSSSPTCSTSCAQSAVKVDDVTVGSVRSVDVDGYTARVVVSVNADVVLPANSRAPACARPRCSARSSSASTPPPDQRGRRPAARRRDHRPGPHHPQRRDRGGAVGALAGAQRRQPRAAPGRSTPSWSTALEGREDRGQGRAHASSTPSSAGSTQQKAQIVRALDSLDRLTARLVDRAADDRHGARGHPGRRRGADRAARGAHPGADLARRARRRRRPASSARRSQHGRRPAGARADPHPAQRGRRRRCRESLELLTTYPFPRTVTEGIKGDYANLFITAGRQPRAAPAGRGRPDPARHPAGCLARAVGRRSPRLPLPLPGGAARGAAPAPAVGVTRHARPQRHGPSRAPAAARRR